MKERGLRLRIYYDYAMYMNGSSTASMMLLLQEVVCVNGCYDKLCRALGTLNDFFMAMP